MQPALYNNEVPLAPGNLFVVSTMRRDLLNNVLRLWAGIFLLNFSEYLIFYTKFSKKFKILTI